MLKPTEYLKKNKSIKINIYILSRKNISLSFILIDFSKYTYKIKLERERDWLQYNIITIQINICLKQNFF